MGAGEKIIERIDYSVARRRSPTFNDVQTRSRFMSAGRARPRYDFARASSNARHSPMPAGQRDSRPFQVDATACSVKALEVGTSEASIVVQRHCWTTTTCTHAANRSARRARCEAILREHQSTQGRLIEATRAAWRRRACSRSTSAQRWTSCSCAQRSSARRERVRRRIRSRVSPGDCDLRRPMDRSIRAALAGRRIDELAGVGRRAE